MLALGGLMPQWVVSYSNRRHIYQDLFRFHFVFLAHVSLPVLLVLQFHLSDPNGLCDCIVSTKLTGVAKTNKVLRNFSSQSIVKSVNQNCRIYGSNDFNFIFRDGKFKRQDLIWKADIGRFFHFAGFNPNISISVNQVDFFRNFGNLGFLRIFFFSFTLLWICCCLTRIWRVGINDHKRKCIYESKFFNPFGTDGIYRCQLTESWFWHLRIKKMRFYR